MKVICSYCRRRLEDKEPLDNDMVTHAMCDECAVHFMKQWRGLSLGEYLDQFGFTVLVVRTPAS